MLTVTSQLAELRSRFTLPRHEHAGDPNTTTETDNMEWVGDYEDEELDENLLADRGYPGGGRHVYQVKGNERPRPTPRPR